MATPGLAECLDLFGQPTIIGSSGSIWISKAIVILALVDHHIWRHHAESQRAQVYTPTCEPLERKRGSHIHIRLSHVISPTRESGDLLPCTFQLTLIEFVVCQRLIQNSGKLVGLIENNPTSPPNPTLPHSLSACFFRVYFSYLRWFLLPKMSRLRSSGVQRRRGILLHFRAVASSFFPSKIHGRPHAGNTNQSAL